jgi:hypothetical protein
MPYRSTELSADPLAQCNVTGVDGLYDTDATGRRIDPVFSTAYVGGTHCRVRSPSQSN